MDIIESELVETPTAAAEDVEFVADEVTAEPTVEAAEEVEADESATDEESSSEATIKQAAPLAEEGFGYGVPGFKLNGKQLVNFSAFKNHIGLYPTPSAIEKFKNELSVYKTSKGAIQFPFDKPIPYDLVKRIVEYRVKVLSG
jgi:uncharacterized protein YdhG (YjbR/CyaY superfamily)